MPLILSVSSSPSNAFMTGRGRPNAGRWCRREADARRIVPGDGQRQWCRRRLMAQPMEDAMDATSATSEEAFHAFEHAGWEAVPRQYDESFGVLTVQSIEPLLDATEVRDGLRVLDVATGPG